MTGAGVIAGSVVTRYALTNFGDKLPGLAATNSPGTRNMAGIAYSILIPGLAGIFLRKYNRNISDGLIIGGLAAAGISAINVYGSPQIKATLGLSAAPGYAPMRALGAAPNGFSAIRGAGMYASVSPFPSSNW